MIERPLNIWSLLKRLLVGEVITRNLKVVLEVLRTSEAAPDLEPGDGAKQLMRVLETSINPFLQLTTAESRSWLNHMR